MRGDRGRPLSDALRRISEEPSGIMVILRQPEGPRDLIDAVQSLQAPRSPTAKESGHVLRTYGIGAQILQDVGVRRMRVLSAPKQMHGISAFGLEITDYVDSEP